MWSKSLNGCQPDKHAGYYKPPAVDGYAKEKGTFILKNGRGYAAELGRDHVVYRSEAKTKDLPTNFPTAFNVERVYRDDGLGSIKRYVVKLWNDPEPLIITAVT